MAKKLADLLFLGAILVVLTAGLVSTLLFPDEINYYENRYANQMPSFTPESYLDGSFQQGVDDALSDQVNLAAHYKRFYNLARTGSLWPAVASISKSHPDRYINCGSIWLFGGEHLVYGPSFMGYLTHSLEDRAENYNSTFARLPDTRFYVYYIERDNDISFETGEKVRIYEYLRDRLDLAPDHISRFRVDNFAQFSRSFYRTDHHWNHRGSYRGYLDVLELLGVQDEPLAPLEEVAVPGHFSGSKVSSAKAAGIWEPVSMYRFDFPGMDVTVNGRPAGGYGNQELFWSGQGWTPSYGNIYGGDMGELVFSGGRPGGGNILVVGESYDNAILRLLASHFETLRSVDLRYYSAYMGKDFRLSEYLEEHGIDRVLLIGGTDYFTMSEFRLEG